MKSPTPAPAAQVAQSERELFEAAMNDARFFPAELSFAMTKSPSGRDEYANSHLESCWTGWQARAALARPVAQSDPTDIKAACYRVDWSSDRPAGGLLLDAMKAEIADLRAALASRAPASGAVAAELRNQMAYISAYSVGELDTMSRDRLLDMASSIITRAQNAIAAAGTPAIPPAPVETVSEDTEISYMDLELMYAAQCKCADEWADKYRAEVERKADATLQERVVELESSLAQVNARLAQAQSGSLLREPISATNPLPPGCYCKPGQCGAPKPNWCRDAAKRDATPAPTTKEST